MKFKLENCKDKAKYYLTRDLMIITILKYTLFYIQKKNKRPIFLTLFIKFLRYQGMILLNLTQTLSLLDILLYYLDIIVANSLTLRFILQ